MAWLALRALGIGPGDEVIASTYGWHQVAQAVELAGARVVFSDINYWSGCLDPVRAAAQVTPATRALIAGNVNGHPAAWEALRALAAELEVDELVVITWTWDPAAQRRSYELLAHEFALS